MLVVHQISYSMKTSTIIAVALLALVVLVGLHYAEASRGNSCVRNQDCVAWVCVFGECRPLGGPGADCDESSDCKSNNCALATFTCA
jgi:hypothetical protein